MSMMDDQPVTKAELLEALAATKAEILEAVSKRLEQTETSLLKAFFDYQEHADVRLRKVSADVSNISAASEQRLNNLERRVVEIEKKLLLKPPQP